MKNFAPNAGYELVYINMNYFWDKLIKLGRASWFEKKKKKKNRDLLICECSNEKGVYHRLPLDSTLH
jgi:hypothetical protein